MKTIKSIMFGLAAVLATAVSNGTARVVTPAARVAKERPEAEEDYAADRHETKAARKRRMREVQRKAFKGE